MKFYKAQFNLEEYIQVEDDEDAFYVFVEYLKSMTSGEIDRALTLTCTYEEKRNDKEELE